MDPSEHVGKPLPEIGIYTDRGLQLSNADDGDHFDYKVGLEDVGQDLRFSCHWRQIIPGGELLYSGIETSRSISIQLSPVIGDNSKTR